MQAIINSYPRRKAIRAPMSEVSESLPFSDILTEKEMNDFLASCPEYRQRIFTPDVTLKAFLSQVINKEGSCQQAVAQIYCNLAAHGKKTCSLKTSSYVRARQKIPLLAFKKLGAAIAQGNDRKIEQKNLWKNHSVKMGIFEQSPTDVLKGIIP